MDNSHLWFLNICFFTYTAVKKLYLYICWCIISSLKTELILALSCQQVSFFSFTFWWAGIILSLAGNCIFFHSHFCILKNAFKIIFTWWNTSSQGFIIFTLVLSDWIFQSQKSWDLSHFLLKTAWNYSWECWYYFEGFFFLFSSAKK